MKKIVLILAAGLLASGVVAGQLWRDLHAVRAQSAQLRERITVLQATPVAANSPVPAFPSQSSTEATAAITPTTIGAQTVGSAARPATTAAAGAAATDEATEAQAKPADLMAGVSKIMSTPAGRDMMAAQMRMMMPRQYPDLGKELGLGKADEEKFFDMLARQQSQLSSDALGGLAGGQMDRAAAQELQRKIVQTQQANQAEVAALLGDKTPAWQEYQQTLPIRRQVNQLQTALGGSNNALTDNQTKSVITAMAAEQTRINEERRNAPRPPPGTAVNITVQAQLQRESVSSLRMVEAAATQLNSDQADAFRKLVEQQQDTTRTLVRSLNLQP